MDFQQAIEQLGFHNQETFEKYYDNKIKNGATLEETELLSPDKIDNCAFWEFVDKNFSKSICGNQPKEYHGDSNWERMNNLRLALTNGVYSNLACYLISSINQQLLEIGPGNGDLQEYLRSHFPVHNYNAIDVYPRYRGVVKGNGQDISPFKDMGAIYSSNVFQHLSLNQRNSYYKAIEDGLVDGGLAIINISTCNTTHRHYIAIPESPYKWICHYGQYTPIQTIDQVKEDLYKRANLGFISSTVRFDGQFTVVLQKMPKPKDFVSFTSPMTDKLVEQSEESKVTLSEKVNNEAV